MARNSYTILAKVFNLDPRSWNDLSFVSAMEYAYTMKMTMAGNVYSFGVILLELVTGKLTVREGTELAKWHQLNITSHQKPDASGAQSCFGLHKCLSRAKAEDEKCSTINDHINSRNNILGMELSKLDKQDYEGQQKPNQNGSESSMLYRAILNSRLLKCSTFLHFSLPNFSKTSNPDHKIRLASSGNRVTSSNNASSAMNKGKRPINLNIANEFSSRQFHMQSDPSMHDQANPGYANFREGGLANSTEMEIMFSNTFVTVEHSWDPYALEVNENGGREGEGDDEAVEEEENIEVIRNIRTKDSGYDDCGVPNISLESTKNNT
ncbi:hypothetical protein Cgig2_009171 [Carnegiea gigantea]|uniref:Serine-threonine/tyrosine-protein kinase catalytic domain-containing protein n=1 Tax=Carnegiea gigantea TaxID=171969 RepID=A0A9Q1KEF1_9CARY|nr:hypothetical protein Cgig2_009171 [Carnegiea gigantea]